MQNCDKRQSLGDSEWALSASRLRDTTLGRGGNDEQLECIEFSKKSQHSE